MSARWEYKTAILECKHPAGLVGHQSTGHFDQQQLENDLNHLGWEGWELVNVFQTTGYQGGTRAIVGVFKRPSRRKTTKD